MFFSSKNNRRYVPSNAQCIDNIFSSTCHLSHSFAKLNHSTNTDPKLFEINILPLEVTISETCHSTPMKLPLIIHTPTNITHKHFQSSTYSEYDPILNTSTLYTFNTTEHNERMKRLHTELRKRAKTEIESFQLVKSWISDSQLESV